MVYRGRPSKACEHCRRRKLRCDLRRPTCSQCTRAALSCSGYRDTDQLRIEDESQRIARKTQDVVLFSTYHKPLLLTLDEKAKSIFFRHYVFGKYKSYDYLETLYIPIPANEHLTRSINAVSLAYFSHQFNAPEALERARKMYISALRLINKALQNPVTATKDVTLLSTLLLDLYEKMTNYDPRGTGSWTSHVRGAMTLVKMRGAAQFTDPIGLQMLMRFSTNLVISCNASYSRVPEELIALRERAEFFFSAPPGLKWRLTGFVIQWANVRASIRSGELSDLEMIEAVVNLSEKFSALAQEIQEKEPYETVYLESPTERVYRGYFPVYDYQGSALPKAYDRLYHVYADRHATQAWNVLRIVRMSLAEIICRNQKSVQHLSESMSNPYKSSWIAIQVEISLKIINESAYEICSSAPQYVEALVAHPDCNCNATPSVPMPIPLHSQACEEEQQEIPVLAMRCYTTLFSLYVAARSPFVPPELKSWVIKELHFMGKELGIWNAATVAELLESGSDIDPWTLYAQLGGYAFSA